MLSETKSDSALLLLSDMKMEIQSAQLDIRMLYELICFKVKDRAKVKHTTDTVITKVAEFYEKSDDKKRLPEAYYYVGRANSDMNHSVRAMMYYQKALLNDTAMVTPRLKSRIYAQIGYVYLRQGLLIDAKQMQECAHFYCKQIGDTAGMNCCREDIAVIDSLSKTYVASEEVGREMKHVIQRIASSVKTQELERRNEALKEKSKGNSMIIVALCIVVVIILLYALYVRRKRVVAESSVQPAVEEAPKPVSTPQRRQFYSQDVSELLFARINADKALKKSDWDKIEDTLLASFPSFKENLYSVYDLSETEYRICMLIKMEVLPSNMAKLLAMSNSSVSQIRLRLQHKVFDGKGSAKDWDNYVLSL